MLDACTLFLGLRLYATLLNIVILDAKLSNCHLCFSCFIVEWLTSCYVDCVPVCTVSVTERIFHWLALCYVDCVLVCTVIVTERIFHWLASCSVDFVLVCTARVTEIPHTATALADST